MKTLIRGGWIVAFDGKSHRLLTDGVLVWEGDRIIAVGKSYDGPVDRIIDASGRLVSPGFINLHFHAGTEAGGRLIADVGRQDFFQTGYLNYHNVGKGKSGGIDRLETAEVGGKFSLVELMKSGCTTVVEVGGSPQMVEGLVPIAGELGLRAYLTPGYRSVNTYNDHKGRLYFEWDEAQGFAGLQRAREFIQRYYGTYQDRIRGMLFPLQVDTCTPELLRATRDVAQELGVRIQIHVGQNVMEFHNIVRMHGKTPIEFLADIGILGPTTILGHAMVISDHSLSAWPGGQDLQLIADHGCSVAHCPTVFARRGNLLESLHRYQEAGVNIGLGTDTYPRDLIAEMRMASLLCKVVERNFLVGTAGDVFNAATLGGARALGREDIGRLAVGAKADIVIINLQSLRIGPIWDPIKTLVNCATSENVEQVIIDGKTVVEGGRVVGVDETALLAQAQEAASHIWKSMAGWDWGKRSAQEISPPTFPPWES
ncbi:MAG: hypothetical protein D6736_05040 [Nitrospinota bacterium]|nr:MAG: hypothetical protein D6736_05040 [Nitrospinota bacterium]